jgi:hypothetical protein
VVTLTFVPSTSNAMRNRLIYIREAREFSIPVDFRVIDFREGFPKFMRVSPERAGSFFSGVREGYS